MQKPCRECPFRANIKFTLPRDRVQGIVDELNQDGMFPCHETVLREGGEEYQNQRPCIGAAVILENDRPGGLMANYRFRLAVMIGLIKIEKLDKSEVYQTFDQCIASVSRRF